MTLRLARLALDNWDDIDGYAVSRNMPPLASLPLGRFVNFVWWWATRNAQSPAEVEKFRTRLWVPPPKYNKPITQGPWSPESETRAFAALKATLGKVE